MFLYFLNLLVPFLHFWPDPRWQMGEIAGFQKRQKTKKVVRFSLFVCPHTRAFHLTIISLEKLVLYRTAQERHAKVQTNKQLHIFLRAHQNDRHLVAARLHFYDYGISRKQARTVRGESKTSSTELPQSHRSSFFSFQHKHTTRKDRGDDDCDDEQPNQKREEETRRVFCNDG